MPEQARRYERESGAFERVACLTDGVYAIALTLIVVGVGVPTLQHSGAASELWEGLGDHLSEFISFLIGVLVLGFYWPAHQASFDQLRAIDRGYVIWTMLYLGAIAFLPYPIRLVGSYSDNPVAWAIFAANLAVVSGLEAVLFTVRGDTNCSATSCRRTTTDGCCSWRWSRCRCSCCRSPSLS